MSEIIGVEEAFYLEFGWFMGHVKSLAMSAEACCDDQGSYNLAHEIWYFLTTSQLMLQDPIGVMNPEQRALARDLVGSVQALPEDARRWTTVAQESINNMNHEAWTDARCHAKKLLASMASISELRDKYFS